MWVRAICVCILPCDEGRQRDGRVIVGTPLYGVCDGIATGWRSSIPVGATNYTFSPGSIGELFDWRVQDDVVRVTPTAIGVCVVIDVCQGKLVERRNLTVSHVQIKRLVVCGLSWIGVHVVVKGDLEVVDHVGVSEILRVSRRHRDYNIGAAHTQ